MGLNHCSHGTSLLFAYWHYSICICGNQYEKFFPFILKKTSKFIIIFHLKKLRGCENFSECYYIDSNGYMLANTTTPDGYQVNADGQWVENGTVKTRLFAADLGDLHPEADDQLAANASATTGSGPVTDANSIQKITFNMEVMDWLTHCENALDRVPNKTLASSQHDAFIGPTYICNYNGAELRVSKSFGCSNTVEAFFFACNYAEYSDISGGGVSKIHTSNKQEMSYC